MECATLANNDVEETVQYFGPAQNKENISAPSMESQLKVKHFMLRPRPSMPPLEKFNCWQFELAW